MPEWLSQALPVVPWAGVAFMVVMYFRIRRVARGIARAVSELETYRPTIAAVQEHDAECTVYQATQIVLGLFALRVGAPITFGE